MKRAKYLGLFCFVIFSSLGAYLLHDSIISPGPYAEEEVLLGAVLFAFAVAAMTWAIRQHFMAKALHRHLHRHTALNRGEDRG
jgi:hypothetical protein